jgi:hypothetical protein
MNPEKPGIHRRWRVPPVSEERRPPLRPRLYLNGDVGDAR